MNIYLQESETHWKNNVGILENYKGAIYSSCGINHYIAIEEKTAPNIYFDSIHCACCDEYSGSCKSPWEDSICPLALNGNDCSLPDSPWKRFKTYVIYNSTINEELIDRAKDILDAIRDTILKEG